MKANYRLFDCTEGQATCDIYASNYLDAIRQGREWMEGGSWVANTWDTTLECKAAPIDENGTVLCDPWDFLDCSYVLPGENVHAYAEEEDF